MAKRRSSNQDVRTIMESFPGHCTLRSRPSTVDGAQLVLRAVLLMAEAWPMIPYELSYDKRPSDVGIFFSKDGLDHLYSLTESGFACLSPEINLGWEVERSLAGINVEGVDPLDRSAMVAAIHEHHSQALKVLE